MLHPRIPEKAVKGFSTRNREIHKKIIKQDIVRG
jgi:hypothetical protein